VIDHGVGFGVHTPAYAIIGSLAQAETCDNRDCDSRMPWRNYAMDERPTLRPENAEIFKRLDFSGKKQRDLAQVLDIAENKVSKVRAGDRRFTAAEILKARAWLDAIELGEDVTEHPDQQEPQDVAQAYVPVEVLPSFGGMGGGGTGEGDRETALVPRALVIDILRGKPSDFMVINVRGDSMEPDFHQGDQLLIDKRDKSPAQPGPFALWDGEWGEYVVKNVERATSGQVRIFSSNPKYSDHIVESENSRIIGRPVWFGRQL
jgi:phage repressor protein C with HTH and peptisase S24 domain